jgi:hypothetical protein
MIVNAIGGISLILAPVILIISFQEKDFPASNFQAIALFLIAAAICFK